MRRLRALIVLLRPVRAVLPVHQHPQGGEVEDGAERRRTHLHLGHWRRRHLADGVHQRPVNGVRMVVTRMARGILTSEGCV